MKNQINSFQGLRAIAILLILFSHLATYIPPLRKMGLGVNGVSIFIMLSGFCSYYAYENKWITLPSISDTGAYLKKKLAKFYPLHIFTFLLVIPVEFITLNAIMANTSLTERLLVLVKRGAANLLLIQSFIPYQDIYFSFNQTSWYLSDTIFFCVCTPIVLFLIQKLTTKKLWVGFGMLFILQIMISIYIAPTVYAHAFLYISPFYRILEYIQGCVLAKLFLQAPSLLQTRRSCTIAEVISGGLFLGFILLYPQLPAGFSYSVIYVPFTAFVLWSFAFDGGTLSKLLSTAPFRFIGNISFEIFLVHLVVFRYMNLFRPRLAFLNDSIFAAVSAILALIASWMIHKLFVSLTASLRKH